MPFNQMGKSQGGNSRNLFAGVCLNKYKSPENKLIILFRALFIAVTKVYQLLFHLF